MLAERIRQRIKSSNVCLSYSSILNQVKLIRNWGWVTEQTISPGLPASALLVRDNQHSEIITGVTALLPAVNTNRQSTAGSTPE